MRQCNALGISWSGFSDADRICQYVSANDKVLGYFSFVNKSDSSICEDMR